ncbi:MAG: hypothetical protein AB8G22_05150 [Saprospiraceae bacterium]
MQTISFKFFTLFVLFLMSILTACNKDEENVTLETNTVTEEEIVDAVTVALSENGAGVSQEAQDVATLADDLENFVSDEIIFRDSPCDINQDSTTTFSHNDTRLSANYESNWKWKVNCNNNSIPQTIDYQRSTSGTYETPRLNSTDAATSSWVLSSLITGDDYLLNGSYSRKGTQTSKVRDQVEFTSTINIELDNLSLDKGEKRISSGIASFSMSGETNDGNNFSVNGDIVFLGNGAATLVINGNTYQIELY